MRAAALASTALTGLTLSAGLFVALGAGSYPAGIAQYYLKQSFTVSGLQAVVIATVPTNGSLRTNGYDNPGDGGGNEYVYSTSNCSLNAGAGDGGSQIAPNSGGGCWLAQPDGSGWDARKFGVLGLNADYTTRLQNAAAASCGLRLMLPTGITQIHATIAPGCSLKLAGQGSGIDNSGQTHTTNATSLWATGAFLTGDMVAITVNGDCEVSGINFTGASYRTANAALHISSPSSGVSSLACDVHDNAFNGQFVDGWGTRLNMVYWHHNFGANFVSRDYYGEGSATVEAGLDWHDNWSWDTKGGGGSATALIELHHGYFRIHSSHLLSGQFAVRQICDVYPCGSSRIWQNVIEQQTVAPVDISSSNSIGVSMVDIDHNEVSVINGTSRPGDTLQVALLSIHAFTNGGTLDTVTIAKNHVRSDFSNAAGVYCINIQQPSVNVSSIDDNQCYDHSASSTSYGLALGSSATGWEATENKFSGMPEAHWYLNQAAARVVDHIGLHFANIGTLGSAINGSQVFVVDGAPASSPLTGSSSGAMAFRKNGAWAGF